MKRAILITSFSISTLFFISCGKEDHTIRFRNNYGSTILNTAAGTANIGTVNSGETSGYVPIATGNFDVSGTSTSGEKLVGSGSVKGKGRHKWTLVLSSAGTISLSED